MKKKTHLEIIKEALDAVGVEYRENNFRKETLEQLATTGIDANKSIVDVSIKVGTGLDTTLSFYFWQGKFVMEQIEHVDYESLLETNLKD